MKKCILIYNPQSGKKDFVNHLDYVVNRLEESGYNTSVIATERPRHAIKLAKESCMSKVDLLVISGGDGTIHECINGLAVCDYKPKIGYIPSGTACDFASTLKIPKNVAKALDIILTGETVKMDIAKSNRGYFIYVNAIGTYVDISYVTDSKLKKYLGYFAYVITGLKEFFTIPMIKTKIEHDNGTLRGYFSLIMVINSRKVAGFNIINKPVLITYTTIGTTINSCSYHHSRHHQLNKCSNILFKKKIIITAVNIVIDTISLFFYKILLLLFLPLPKFFYF